MTVAGPPDDGIDHDLGDRTDGAPGQTAALFRLSGRRFAVAAGDLDSVLPVAPVTRLPGAPPGVLGLLAARGRVIAVIDPREVLAMLTSRAAEADATPSRLLVTRTIEGTVALVVDVVDSVSATVRPAGDATPPDQIVDLVDAAALVRAVAGTATEPETLSEPVEVVTAAATDGRRDRPPSGAVTA